MKKNIFFLCLISLLLNAVQIETIAAAWEKCSVKLFYVYSDKGAQNSNFFIPSGWMGDYTDLTMLSGWKENPQSGQTCIKVTYTNRASGGARWAGIYWQNPEKNWGSNPEAGVDLTGIKKLTFWAKGDRGGERIEEFKIGGLSGQYPDSDTASIGPVILTSDWKQYTINLSKKNLTHIIGGFAWSLNLDGNPGGCTFYLDEIRYE